MMGINQEKMPIAARYHGSEKDIDTMRLEANKIGYPILTKSIHGGGGKVCPFCFSFSSISFLLDFLFYFLKNCLNCELNFFFISFS